VILRNIFTDEIWLEFTITPTLADHAGPASAPACPCGVINRKPIPKAVAMGFWCVKRGVAWGLCGSLSLLIGSLIARPKLIFCGILVLGMGIASFFFRAV